MHLIRGRKGIGIPDKFAEPVFFFIRIFVATQGTNSNLLPESRLEYA